jgi:hypothetical protein
VRRREAVDGETLHPGEDLVRLFDRDAVLPGPPQELPAQFLHRAGSPVFGHGASQKVSLREAEAGDGVRHGEDLLLEDEHAVGGFEDFFQLGQDRPVPLPAVLPHHIRGDEVSPDGARSEQRDLGDEVREPPGLQPPAQLHLAGRLELEHPRVVAGPDQGVGTLVLGWQIVGVDLSAQPL